MKTCAEIMTERPLCCLPSDMIVKAAKIMQDENVGSVPVIESEEHPKVVGIITDRDITLQTVADGMSPQETTVQSVMSTDPITCHEHDDVEKVLKLMAGHQIRRIPVVNDDDEIVGIISQGDVAIRVDKPLAIGKVVEQISKPDGSHIF